MMNNISSKIFPENIHIKSNLISYTKKIFNISKSKKIGIFQLPGVSTNSIIRSYSLGNLEKYVNEQITTDDIITMNISPNTGGYVTPEKDSSSSFPNSSGYLKSTSELVMKKIQSTEAPLTKHFSENCLLKLTSNDRSYDFSSNHNNVSSCFSSLCSLSSMDNVPSSPLSIEDKLDKMKGIVGVSLEYLSGYTEDFGKGASIPCSLCITNLEIDLMSPEEFYNVQSPRNYFKIKPFGGRVLSEAELNDTGSDSGGISK